MGAATPTAGSGVKPPPHPASCYGGEAEAIQKIADLTIQGVKPEVVMLKIEGLGAGLPDAIPVLITPGEDGGAVSSVKAFIDAYRTQPDRRRGSAMVTTLASFIALVNRHRSEDSVIFAKADWPNPALTAVIDYHTKAGDARNADHKVVYTFPVTEEFKAWISHVGKPFTQLEFAAFLEDHAAELASPTDGERSEYERLFKAKFATPNELIDLARSLEISVGQTFKQAVRLASGEAEMVFKEEHTNGVGEKVTVPGIFMISLRAFIGGDPVIIPARLRYRAGGGSVTWFYDLYRWQDFLRERVSQDLLEAGAKTGLPTFEGAPETSGR